MLTDDGWLATGDIVEQRDGAEIAVVDRKKAIIITSGGKNIAPSEIENALKDNPFIREAIVVGEGKKFLGGLIQIDFDTVGRWAGERDLQYTTYKSLTQMPQVHELVQGIVDTVNSRFARVENIRRFVILEKELDHDDGELTATQKVRRGLINQKFARELEQIYGGRSDALSDRVGDVGAGHRCHLRPDRDGVLGDLQGHRHRELRAGRGRHADRVSVWSFSTTVGTGGFGVIASRWWRASCWACSSSGW